MIIMNRRRQTNNLSGDEQDPLLNYFIQDDKHRIINNNHAESNQHISSHNQNRPSWFQHESSSTPIRIIPPKLVEITGPNSTQLPCLQPVAIHQSTSNQQYSDSIDMNDGYELHRLRGNHSRAIDLTDTRNPRHQQPTEYVYYIVQKGDTLLNLSLKFSCDIASIKRLNNLWTDQDLHGLTRLKLPVGRFRLIEDDVKEENRKANIPGQQTISTENFRNTSSPINHSTDRQLEDSRFQNADRTNIDNNYPSYIPTLTNEPHNSRDSDSIFKDLDLNIEKARSAAQSYNEHAAEIMQTLAQSGNRVGEDEYISDSSRIARQEAETLLNDLSDYGLTYSGLILFIFIVCLICPLAYVIYLEETHISHDANKAS